MKKRWLILGSSSIMAIVAVVMMNSDQSKTDVVMEHTPNSKKQQSQSNQTTVVPTSASTLNSGTKKNNIDIYQSYRKDNVTIVDGEQAKVFLKEHYIPSHRTEEDFVFSTAKYGSEGSTYYNFQQTYQGLNVYGAEVVVQVNNEQQLQAVLGKYSEALQLSVNPSVDATEALNTALNNVSNGDKAEQKIYKDPKLIVYMDYDNNAHLAYESVVKFKDPSGDVKIEQLFIDAHSARVIQAIDRIHTERDIDVYSLNGNCLGYGANLPGNLKRNSDTVSGTTSVDNAYDYLDDAYQFYKHMFNRYSYDSNDATITATVDAKFSSQGGCSGLNAFFSPDDKQLVFGTGDSSTNNFSAAADVVAHELTHAVTWKTSNLEYQNESGALNESLSDIFGVTIQAWVRSGGGQTGNPSSINIEDDTWQLGEELGNTSFIRYMNDPTRDGRSPDNYDDKVTGSADNGGVHSNSGIPNLAYALLATGGTHPQNETDVVVPGIGMEKAIRIWYEAQTTSIQTRTDFDNIRAALANAAATLYDECSPEYKALQLSMDAVKMPGTWECTEPDTTPPQITLISPINGATGIAVDSVIKISFDEPMDANTLNSTNIALTDMSGTVVNTTMTLIGQTLTITPDSSLAYEGSYTLSISTGISDVSGNNMQKSISVSFTTSAKPDTSDTTPPSINSVSPSENSMNVAKDTTVVVQFSETINADSALSAWSLVDATNTVVNGSISVSGSQLTFTPTTALNPQMTYTATVNTDLTDSAGNKLASAKSWSFTTVADQLDKPVSLSDASMSSSSFYNFAYKAANAADGDLKTEWVSRTITGGWYQSEWIQANLAQTGYVNKLTITWNGYYYPGDMQLWAVIDGSWQMIDAIRKSSPGATTFHVNAEVEALHLAMRGSRYGSWIVIKEMNVE